MLQLLLNGERIITGWRAGISVNTFSCKLGRKACPKPSISTGSVAASSVRVFGRSIEKFKNSSTCEERFMFIKALCTFDCVHLVSSNYGSTRKTKFRRTCKTVYKQMYQKMRHCLFGYNYKSVEYKSQFD